MIVNSVESLVAKHEGTRFDIYLDSVGHRTVGIGHNLDAAPLPEGWTTPLTQDQVDRLFQIDLANAIAPMSTNWPWFSSLDPVRQAVLIDMCFNSGFAGLSTFKHTLTMIESGDYSGAATNMLESLWAKQVGIRAIEDSRMMNSGLWPSDPDFPTT